MVVVTRVGCCAPVFSEGGRDNWDRLAGMLGVVGVVGISRIGAG